MKSSKEKSSFQAPQEWPDYVSGWGAAVVNIFVTFPINKTMFRQQVHGVSTINAIKMLKDEGAIYLYRGILPPLLQKSTSTCIMFGTYSHYNRLMSDFLGIKNNTYNNKVKALAAFLAGCTEATLIPLERVQVLMQETKYNGMFKNTPNAFYLIYTNYGLREFFRGLTPILMRNGPSNVIFFTSREKMKKMLPPEWTERGKFTTYLADFITGALNGALISTIFFPVNVTKTHMQLVIGGPYSSFWTVFKDLLAKRGIRNMFAGVHVNYTRSFISWGIINFMYEFIHERLL